MPSDLAGATYVRRQLAMPVGKTPHHGRWGRLYRQCRRADRCRI